MMIVMETGLLSLKCQTETDGGITPAIEILLPFHRSEVICSVLIQASRFTRSPPLPARIASGAFAAEEPAA
jgi:hypothetical protein